MIGCCRAAAGRRCSGCSCCSASPSSFMGVLDVSRAQMLVDIGRAFGDKLSPRVEQLQWQFAIAPPPGQAAPNAGPRPYSWFHVGFGTRRLHRPAVGDLLPRGPVPATSVARRRDAGRHHRARPADLAHRAVDREEHDPARTAALYARAGSGNELPECGHAEGAGYDRNPLVAAAAERRRLSG